MPTATADPVLEDLNEDQRQAVLHTEGPLLLIAGPGAGKTLTLIRRTLRILREGLAEPGEVVLCTFTEKAAYELKDRLGSGAREIGYDGDLSGLRVGTIHGICNEFVDRHRHLTPLGNGYEVLNDLTQRLFIFEHADEILGEPDADDRFLGRWKGTWRTIDSLCRYFDKVTEELIAPEALATSEDPFISAMGTRYASYKELLIEGNRTDFAHIQRFFVDLLDDVAVGREVAESVRYVMVDEYQDTNFIQERLLSKLSSGTGNLCVVGDEDQALYRFRGATVRNILEFPERFPRAEVIKLTTNYRSHERIIRAYDTFMSSSDWANHKGGPDFRYEKTIEPPAEAEFPDYPAVFSIWGTTAADEAKRFADLIAFLRREEVIEDYSQVALLLHSVRSDYSGPYIEALEKRGIPAFCPRARAFFDNEEVGAMVGCLAVILGWIDGNRGELHGYTLPKLADLADQAIASLAHDYADPHPLGSMLRRFVADVEGLDEEGSLDRRVPDFFYELLSVEPFAAWMRDETRARNLALLSQLLNEFQRYYHFGVLTRKNIRRLRMTLFNSFLRLLLEGGINEFEDPDQPFPKGYVQVMTIHQAKGLEFPVVIVGSLAQQISVQKQVERELAPYCTRLPFEPEDRITAFDRMRLYYVAFSRAERILVLTSNKDPKPHFDPIWGDLPQYPYVEKDLLSAQAFTFEERLPVKKAYSFTGDLKVYETCPRQYQMFRHYDFTPSRSAVIFFGLLVHQTIEDVHRMVLAGNQDEIDQATVEGLFQFNFRHLSRKDVKPIGIDAKAAALRHVLDYVNNNRAEMKRIVEAEVDVSLEKAGYVLTGAIDLLRAHDGTLEVLDFKAQKRPLAGDPVLATYYDQLCIYAHILEERRSRKPDRLLLYWTGERSRAEALMEFPYKPEDVEAASTRFDEIVGKVQALDFDVVEPPGPEICKECDFRPVCLADGTITGD